MQNAQQHDFNAKLPFKVKLSYGFSGYCSFVTWTIFSYYGLYFFTENVGLSAAFAGAMISLGTLWDAITDPVMGNIVERTHSKFGAKRFYILIGSFASAILSMLLLIVAVIFPMTSGEYDLVIREVARRKGEEKGEATEEEKKMLEEVTGFAYERLWDRD